MKIVYYVINVFLGISLLFSGNIYALDADFRGQISGISRFEQEPRPALFDQFAESSDPRGHDRPSVHHRFRDDQGTNLEPATRHRDQAGVSVKPIHPLPVETAHEGDIVLGAATVIMVKA